MDHPNPGTVISRKANLNSKSSFWSDQQQRPASRGETIQSGQFGNRGKLIESGKVTFTSKSPGGPGLLATHRYGQVKMDQGTLGAPASNNNSIVLPFRPATASPYSYGGSSLSLRPSGEENLIHDGEIRNKMSIVNNRNNYKRPPPLSTASEQINRMGIGTNRERPGTAGSNSSGGIGKQNVYRSSASLVTNKFVPMLPLTNKKWVTATTTTREESRAQIQVQPEPPIAPVPMSTTTTIFNSLIPLPIRNTLGYIGDKIREQVSSSPQIVQQQPQPPADEVKAKPRVEVPVRIDTLPSPLSSNYPPLAPYLSPPHGDQLNPIHSIFHTCQQYAPIPLDLIFQDLQRIRKVGEGVYGEVYFGEFKGSGCQSVYKVVAVEGSKIVNGEKQKTFSEIEPEIIVSAQVNVLRDQEFNMGLNFTNGMAKLHWARVCKGRYPASCSIAWKHWDRVNRSENEYPIFDENQLYIVFEYEYGGTDMESYRFDSAAQTFAVLIQVVHTLAAAENAVGFEHRDLHWGNILVQLTREKTTKYFIQGKEFNVPTQGIVSTIIDFTISRTNGKMGGGSPAYTDLSGDNDQFVGTGEYQFEIYRMMKAANGNSWGEFHPETNVYWCHYLADKLLTKAKYVEKAARSLVHMRNMKNLQIFKDRILKYTCCTEFVMNSPEFLE